MPYAGVITKGEWGHVVLQGDGFGLETVIPYCATNFGIKE